MKGFEVQHYTVSKVDKEKNGDHYLVNYFQDEQLLLAAVSDGVSQQPCDWFASQQTCEQLEKFFIQYLDEPNIQLRLEKSIRATNEFIIKTEGRCEKMATTLSAVVLDKKNDTLYYANIGDSRIYSLNEEGLTQITSDDFRVIQERHFTRNGSRLVNKNILTKVIGQRDIEIQVHTRKVLTNEILILATDGFYEARKASFEKIIVGLYNATDFEETSKKIIMKFEMFRGDDFTIIIIKNKGLQDKQK